MGLRPAKSDENRIFDPAALSRVRGHAADPKTGGPRYPLLWRREITAMLGET